jgi:hypothetical protein
VSIGPDQEQNPSREASIIALAHARDQIAGHSDKMKSPIDVRGLPSNIGDARVERPEGPARGVTSAWRLYLGLCVLVTGAILLGWGFLIRSGEDVPLSASPVTKQWSADATPLGAVAADANAVTPKRPIQVELPSSAELAQSTESKRRELPQSKLESELDRLKTQQMQMLQKNSELDNHLREIENLSRNSAELIKDLKSAQSQMAQDNASLAAQVKANVERVATIAAQMDAGRAQMTEIAAQIKESQDQIARLAEHKQKQRSKSQVAASPLASRPTTSGPAKRLAP